MSKEVIFKSDELLSASHSTLILKHLHALKSVLGSEDQYIDFLIEKHQNIINKYESANYESVSFTKSQISNCRNGYRRSIQSKYSNTIDIKKFIASENFEKMHIYFTAKYPQYQANKLARESHEMLVNEVTLEYIEFIKKTHPKHVLKQLTDDERLLKRVKPIYTEECEMCGGLFLGREIGWYEVGFEGKKMSLCGECHEKQAKKDRQKASEFLTNF